MAERTAPGRVATPMLEVVGLDVSYGRVPILKGLSFRLDRGVLAIVGRNGMGKSTLCKSIAGLMRPSSGTIRIGGTDTTASSPHSISRMGVGYVPQGRRCWPSLSVDEHLRLAASTHAKGPWTLDRIYETFPRLKERRTNGGAALSGGEQQMLAISRALATNPRLLVMDEPTEGLAPVIVEHVERIIRDLAEEGSMSVLIIEQQLGVALDIADRVAIMLHGEIAREMSPGELRADTEVQRRLLGVGRHADAVEEPAADDAPPETRYIRVVRDHERGTEGQGYTFAAGTAPVYSTGRAPNRWTADNREPPRGRPERDANSGLDEDAAPDTVVLPPVPVAAMVGRKAYVVGTFDTKRDELTFLANNLKRLGVPTVTVDLATSGRPSPAQISPREVAGHHPQGSSAVFTGDRGASVSAMADAFERFMATRRDVGGIISAGGSGGTALATAGMRALAIGIPKLMVSTVASSDVSRYVGPSDISMMYSVTDVQGINAISERVLSNAANALAGMIGHQQPDGRSPARKAAIGLTMFGVTTPCVQMVQQALQADYDCMVFHATGTGGRSMEKLVDSKMLVGVIDVTTTEVPDFVVGGVFPATTDRFGAVIRTKVPFVGSCGALDMVNFGPLDTVPARFKGRNLYVHNPNVTLMRTTPEECERIGRFIVERLNRMDGPVRFLIPEGGVSVLDAPGKPFHDPIADRALFSTIERSFRATSSRRLVKLPYNLNDPMFARALVENFWAIARPAQPTETKRAAYR